MNRTLEPCCVAMNANTKLGWLVGQGNFDLTSLDHHERLLADTGLVVETSSTLQGHCQRKLMPKMQMEIARGQKILCELSTWRTTQHTRHRANARWHLDIDKMFRLLIIDWSSSAWLECDMMDVNEPTCLEGLAVAHAHKTKRHEAKCKGAMSNGVLPSDRLLHQIVRP